MLSNILLSHSHFKGDIIRGDGVYLIDSAGKRYIDFVSGIWCAALGHKNIGINRCITDQIGKITHLNQNYINHIADDAAEKLLGHTPFPDGKALFLNSGSEAVETAIRLACEHTGRKNLLRFEQSYLGAYGLGGNRGDSAWKNLDLFKCLDCRCESCDESCPQLNDINFDRIAAFVMEPVMVGAGIRMAPIKAVHFITQKIKKHDGLFVADEVTTGLGRVGRWLGSELLGVEPDIIAFGKILGNGYPISAVAMRREIATNTEKKGLYYVQSHQNDPLGCRVALEVIRQLESSKLIERSEKMGSILLNSLEDIRSNHPIVADARGYGSLAGLEIQSAYSESILKIHKHMLRSGFIIGVKPKDRLLRFLPPFIIKKIHIEEMIKSLDAIITSVEKKHGIS